MNYFSKHIKRIICIQKGFVLPFTLFVCAIMLLISVGISSVLQKQLYFSQLAKQSQIAYHAADNAMACALSIDETYVDANGMGIFPYDSSSLTPIADMTTVLNYVNSHRVLTLYSPLAPDLDHIVCAQSQIFATTAYPDFKVNPTNFIRNYTDAMGNPATESGLTSTFTMHMDMGGGEYICANVKVNKTASYRQIVVQGYSRCDRLDGSVERAIINTTITN